jgi:hypothetical protein
MSVTITRSDVIGLLKKPSQPYVLQTASEETLPVMKESLVKLTALSMWVFVARIAEFILELDILESQV